MEKDFIPFSNFSKSYSLDGSWMAVYGAWLLLGQSIFLTLTYSYIFVNNFRIILRFLNTKVRGRLGAAATPALIIHIFIWTLLAFTSIIGNGYLVAFWRPGKQIQVSGVFVCKQSGNFRLKIERKRNRCSSFGDRWKRDHFFQVRPG